MPKQSADKEEMKSVLSVFHETGDWIENSFLIEKLKNKIGDHLENQAYTKKAQIPAYFGFIEWENPEKKDSRKRITSLGKDFYNGLIENNQTKINEGLLVSLETRNFGRNVHGCSSDSDVEPPKVFLKASIILDYLTRKEFGFLIWQMDEKGKSFIDLISEIKINRVQKIFYYNDIPNKYVDAKPITALYNWGILEGVGTESGREKIKISSQLNTSDLRRILNLSVKNNTRSEIGFEPRNTVKGTGIIQKIYFGSPGTGKSHRVKELTQLPETYGRVERVTFHPQFDYISFVGGYKPTMDGNNIVYRFVPEIFTKIYVKAWNDPDNDYYLVIEEINRGNCAEIFGDIFQLLDRTGDYKVTPSEELKKYLESQFMENDRVDHSKLMIPKNLNILATMNTSDQSLFPMDSAFKRRWDWEYIPICYEELSDEGNSNPSYNYIIDLGNGSSFRWNDFISKVNLNHIQETPVLGMDKCIGNYFVKPKNGETTIDIESFINKAIFYLWNDVFKDEKNEVFEDNSSYEDFFPIKTRGLKKLTELLERIGVTVNTTPEELSPVQDEVTN